MNCECCENRVGCSLRKKHDDGTAAFSCGIDLGRDKSKTVVCETRNGRLVARYDLPDEQKNAMRAASPQPLFYRKILARETGRIISNPSHSAHLRKTSKARLALENIDFIG